MNLRQLLEAKKGFKLVCGAGNEDLGEVEKLVAIYAKAGCKFFDLAASEEVVVAAKKGLSRVIPLEKQGGYHFCISVGTENDPHVNKAIIDSGVCVNCGACYENCPQVAIKTAIGYTVDNKRCIGCGTCSRVCSQGAVSFEPQRKKISTILTPFMRTMISAVELHCMDDNDVQVADLWADMCENFDGMLSISLGRKSLSDEKIISRLTKMLEAKLPYTVVVQSDGTSMSGKEDTFKATLQAVACGELIQNANFPVYVILSGGTNSKTAELARQCGVDFSGVAIGSYARKIVREYLEQDDLFEDEKSFAKAVKIASELIEKNL